MTDNTQKDRDSLIKIYNNLTPQLKKQLVFTAKIIEETQTIMLDVLKNEEKPKV